MVQEGDLGTPLVAHTSGGQKDLFMKEAGRTSQQSRRKTRYARRPGPGTGAASMWNAEERLSKGRADR